MMSDFNNQQGAPQPDVKASETKHPRDLLFSYYRTQLKKQYLQVLDELSVFKAKLREVQDDDEHVVEFETKIEEAQKRLEDALSTWQGKVDGFILTTEAKEVELKKLSDDVEKVVADYARLLSQLEANQLEIEKNVLKTPLEVLKLHIKNLKQHEGVLAYLSANLKIVTDTHERLERENKVRQEVEQIRQQTDVTARQVLRDHIKKMQDYVDAENGLKKSRKPEKYHEIYGYLRVALDSCPQSAWNEDIKTDLEKLVNDIKNQIETDIHHSKGQVRWLLGFIRGYKSPDWRHYYYNSPRDQIHNLYHTVNEYLTIRNTSNS